MEITYIGRSCFKIKGKTATLVIDPFDPKVGYKLPKLESDVVLLTHDHYDHAYKDGVSGYRLLVEGPGEYEASDVHISGILTYHDAKEGKERGKNTVYVMEIDGLTVCHLGDLGHELDDATLDKLGNVDILLIPVGGTYTIDAEAAAKVISSVEPGIVIPMHFKAKPEDIDLAPLEEFLNEMGVEDSHKKLDKLKISSKSDIPDETQVVVLEQSK